MSSRKAIKADDRARRKHYRTTVRRRVGRRVAAELEALDRDRYPKTWRRDLKAILRKRGIE